MVQLVHSTLSMPFVFSFKFQFHYGSISSIEEVAIQNASENFNSTMVQLVPMVLVIFG